MRYVPRRAEWYPSNGWSSGLPARYGFTAIDLSIVSIAAKATSSGRFSRMLRRACPDRITLYPPAAGADAAEVLTALLAAGDEP